MDATHIKPQIIALAGFPGTGKSTIVRSLRDDFGFPASQIVSYDQIAKEQYKRVQPDFDMTQDVPEAFYLSRKVKLNRLREFYGRARDIVNDGKPALIHLGMIGKVSRTAFSVGTFGKKVSGFWLHADQDELQARLERRKFENLTYGSADPERLAAVFECAATAPKGWRQISTQDSTPKQTAEEILTYLDV